MDNRSQRAVGSGASGSVSESVAAKLAGRRRRVRAIRARVAGLSVATMMATTGVVVVQMVTGNDPAPATAHASSDVTTVASATRTTTAAGTATSTSDARTSSSGTRAHATRRRSSHGSTRAASTPSTVTTSAS